MNIKQSCSSGCKVILFLYLAALSVTSCTAKTCKLQKAKKVEMNDSLVKKTYGDSIYSILSHGKITAMLVKNDSTGVKYDEPKALSKEDSHLLRFLVTDPAMISGDALVYGIVIPCIRFEFRQSKKEYLYLNLDFGLGKWTLTDSTGHILMQYNLGTNDLIRFCHYLYPDNKFINQQYKAIEK